MASPFLEQKYQEYLKRFETETIYELVNSFNRETSCKGWVGVRGAYLEALLISFIKRNVDTSEISDENSLSLRYPVYYSARQNKVIQIKKEWHKK